MLIIIISRSSLKLGHVGSKTRSLGQQATQVSDLGPLWPSCLKHICYRHSPHTDISNIGGGHLACSLLFIFLWPRDDSQGALRFAPVCPSVCPSVRPFVTLYGIEFV